jgi:acetyl-CoA synthetase (ADP-forming)
MKAACAMIDQAIAKGHAALDEHAAKALFRGLGISVPAGVRLDPERSASGMIDGLRRPLVLKALSSEPIHKSDLGAVRLNLADARAVDAEREEVSRLIVAAGVPLVGFLVEEMAEAGTEIIIGGINDPMFGPMIMVGAGGIYTEILNDARFGLCPICRADAMEMIDGLKIAPILKGKRNRKPIDLEKLVDILMALGGQEGLFHLQADRISEFDVNPLIVRPEGVVAVDSRIVLKK